MLDPAPKGSIQDIAIKITEEQAINRSSDSKERTIFVLGSKGVVSSIKFSTSTTKKKPISIHVVIGKDDAHQQFLGS